MMSAEATAERVREGLAGLDCEALESRDGMTTLRCELAAVPEVAAALRDRCGFELSTCVTAVDHGMEREEQGRPRFDMIWQLQSVTHADRLRLHAWVGEELRVPSLVGLWPGIAYGERECFDMFGIAFDGHAGLKRLLMPEAYEHFPLRKDFPHQGIEPDKLYRAWDASRRADAGGAS